MGTALVKFDKNLPTTVEELQEFIIIGKGLLKAHMAKITAIKKIESAHAATKAALTDAQTVAEIVMKAETKLGDMLKSSSKGTFKKGGEQSLPQGIDKKDSHIAQTIARNKGLVKELQKEAKEKGDILSPNAAYKIINRIERDEKRDETLKIDQGLVEEADIFDAVDTLIEDKFKASTIVIDPPWSWEDEGAVSQMGRAKPTYSSIRYDDLVELPLEEIAAKDSHIYLWITNYALYRGFELLELWDFRYITPITWCKPSIGMGNYFRISTEQCLFGVRGSLPLRRKDMGTWFEAPRTGQHSEKPDMFFTDIVETCSYPPYLEIFGRKERPNWKVLGNIGK